MNGDEIMSAFTIHLSHCFPCRGRFGVIMSHMALEQYIELKEENVKAEKTLLNLDSSSIDDK